MKDVMDAIGNRIRSPYFGYTVLAFFAFNWRGIFLLFALEAEPQARIEAFDCHTSFLTLAIYPLLSGIIVAASTHWVRYAFEVVSRKPLLLIEELRLEAEHDITIRQSELEASRSGLFAVKEKELIDRAKRDSEVSEIEDKDAKERLSRELDTLRNERDSLTTELRDTKKPTPKPVDPFMTARTTLSEYAIVLLKAAITGQKGSIVINVARGPGSRGILSGTEVFGLGSEKEYAKYESGILELRNLGLIKQVDFEGESFELTHDGREAASAL
jgi:hypothetical protein